ncbi:MAG: transporter substrate-binding domain-containing protein [Bermanella sp.]
MPAFIRVIVFFMASIFLNLSLADKAPRFVVGVEYLEYFPQYSYDPEHGHRGAYKAILDLFAQEKGYRFEYKALPVNQLFHAFIHEKLDFKYPDNILWNTKGKSQVKVYYSERVLEFTDGIMVLKNRYGFGLNKLKTLGIPKGFTPAGYTDSVQRNEILLQEGNALKDVLGMLLIGQVDGAYVNKSVANYQLANKYKMAGRAVFDDTLPFVKDAYRLSSIKYPKVIKEFNDFLQDNKTSIVAIKKEYGVL